MKIKTKKRLILAKIFKGLSIAFIGLGFGLIYIKSLEYPSLQQFHERVTYGLLGLLICGCFVCLAFIFESIEKACLNQMALQKKNFT
jgi:hypothetical protein